MDWSGRKYVVITLDLDHQKRTLETSVPGFVKKTLHKLQHPAPEKQWHAPSKADPINYGAKVQTAGPEDNSPLLSEHEIRRVEEDVGTFAWYSRSSDPAMAKTLSSIAGRQSKATEKLKQLKQELQHFLD